MGNIGLGIGALVMLAIGALVMLLPPYHGLPPGWMIVLVLFGIPLLGMFARRMMERED